ncbi:thioredoxin-like protein [Lipomyces tetrasporus]
MIKDLKTIDEFHTAINEDKIVVIDFYAAWCGPCKVIAPKVHAFSEEFTNAEFYKVDVDEVSEVASEVGIRAMPTFMLFKAGQKIKEVRQSVNVVEGLDTISDTLCPEVDC